MWSILRLGLRYGYDAYENPTTSGIDITWWTTAPSNTGNWNCVRSFPSFPAAKRKGADGEELQVCSGGMVIGALAIANEDPTGMAKKILPIALKNMNEGCVNAVSSDGTWSETVNYWYFGTTQHSTAALGLLTATGSTQDLLTSNPAMKLSSMFHM